MPRTHQPMEHMSVTPALHSSRAGVIMPRAFLLPLAALLLLAGCTTPPAGPEARVSSARLATTGAGRAIASETLGTGPLRVYFIGGIHGDESEGLDSVDAVRDAFLRSDASQQATLRIVRDLNPDGTAAGHRLLPTGVDPNRNWPASNFRVHRTSGPAPLSEPEVRAVHLDMVAFRPQLIVVVHSTRRGPFVNFDGPAEALAHAFVDAARSIDPRWRVVADMGYPTPGSMGSYWGIDRQVPILTVELRRGERDTTRTSAVLTAGLLAAVNAARPLTAGAPEIRFPYLSEHAPTPRERRRAS